MSLLSLLSLLYLPSLLSLPRSLHEQGLTSYNGYQLPVVALVMNMGISTAGGRVLVQHSDLETLLHEFGHALHSLLSRTTFQHLSGTRAAADFIETPSQVLLLRVVWASRY